MLQPIFYIFLHLVYMAANSEIQTVTQRVKLIALSPVYAALQYTKLLGASSFAQKKLYDKLEVSAPLKLVTLENCFKVQVFTECFLSTIPQMII